MSRCSSDKLRSIVSMMGSADIGSWSASISPRRGRESDCRLRIPRNDQSFAGLEERLEAGEDLRPALLYGLEGRAPPGKLVVGDGELAHQSHRLDLVGHARGLVLDELRLEAVHQFPPRNHLDHHTFYPRAGPPVQFGPVHIVEPAASLEFRIELEAHVVLARKLRLRERVPERPRRGADVDDVDEYYFRALPRTSGLTTLIGFPATKALICSKISANAIS